MGRRTITASFGAGTLVLFACSYTPVCREELSFGSSLSGGATNCVATFSSGSASVSIAVGNMDAGCSATTIGDQFVSCTSDEVPDAFTCWRVCDTSPPDALLIRAIGDSTARLRTALGDPPIDESISTTVVCNGSVVSSETKPILEVCPL